jgi:hypothetical protein
VGINKLSRLGILPWRLNPNRLNNRLRWDLRGTLHGDWRIDGVKPRKRNKVGSRYKPNRPHACCNGRDKPTTLTHLTLMRGKKMNGFLRDGLHDLQLKCLCDVLTTTRVKCIGDDCVLCISRRNLGVSRQGFDLFV